MPAFCVSSLRFATTGRRDRLDRPSRPAVACPRARGRSCVGGVMVATRFVLVGTFTMVLFPAVLLAQTPTSAWTSAPTVDAYPDLQGVWLSNSATPLERPTAFEGRTRLTE